ncbi:MAG: bifunctional phosphoribosylaminoimidazolecarboxamide formyltransferase/IMP cyclohydrolase [Candidatus Nitronauta litoralis]|uniref:Bifunctional purine biosynthesis protein PurH n=1 Tax=Candidatus Nitronauta litoralis TaxID=2705533 RepID=A0A7T0G020_9BACT|nr:MAG: bifunctional phosphoribosylaminoimidazolecarboxamide formyltransferase/IMP cyclohydrolase [Candidatus Nitronauta litoralis]
MKAIKRALISVSDKSGIAGFAKELHARGVEILSTGGTAELLKGEGIPVTQVSDYTGFPEMMDGRIKTLHPKVHGGILGRRDVNAHMEAMEKHGIQPIDMVVINLYPFEATIAKPGCTLEDAIENIDIGGPAMVRSSAKNYNDVTIVVDPVDYPVVLKEMEASGGEVSLNTRKRLSRTAFASTSRYDAMISGYLASLEDDAPTFPGQFNQSLSRVQELRYGENPHQAAALYREANPAPNRIVNARQLQGKELSFNNYIDMNAAWELAIEFAESSAVIIKHTNPCGTAVGEDQLATFLKARDTDPVSAFGGVMAFNRTLTASTVEEILKNFVEVIVAPGYEPAALELLAKKKNIRAMEMPDASAGKTEQDIKKIGGGLLVQDADRITLDPEKLKVVTEAKPDDSLLNALKFAWVVAKHVKSNAIVYARGQETVGVGAGQMSRVDSARLAVEKANKDVKGCVMASDAFFPFRDSVDAAAQSGITAIIQPGGSIRDQEVIDAANEHGMAMVFTGIRHFKH